MVSPHLWLALALIAAASSSVGHNAPALQVTAVPSEMASIAGRVVDAGGGPVPDVVVTVMGEAGGMLAETRTTPKGTFELAGLRDGSYRVDLDLVDFDVMRYNHVRVSRTVTARLSVTLFLSAMCECISGAPPGGVAVVPVTFRERQGQVVGAAGRPLPHARLLLARGTAVKPVRYADHEGRFRLRLPVDQTWQLTAEVSGFASAAHEVSGSGSAPITFRLVATATAGVPDIERFTRACRCGYGFFTHPGR